MLRRWEIIKSIKTNLICRCAYKRFGRCLRVDLYLSHPTLSLSSPSPTSLFMSFSFSLSLSFTIPSAFLLCRLEFACLFAIDKFDKVDTTLIIWDENGNTRTWVSCFCREAWFIPVLVYFRVKYVCILMFFFFCYVNAAKQQHFLDRLTITYTLC